MTIGAVLPNDASIIFFPSDNIYTSRVESELKELDLWWIRLTPVIIIGMTQWLESYVQKQITLVSSVRSRVFDLVLCCPFLSFICCFQIRHKSGIVQVFVSLCACRCKSVWVGAIWCESVRVGVSRCESVWVNASPCESA